MNRLAPLLLFLTLASSCGTTTTTITDTWKDPGTTKFDFTKVLTLMIIDEDIVRRSAETRLAENIKGVEAIPSHTFLTREDLKDVNKAKAKVKERGIDGAVILRIIAVDEEQQYVSGRYVTDPSYSFWGYYGYYWPRVYEPGYSISRQVITIETKVFSLKEDKLLWSGISRTPQPESVKALVDDLAAATITKLREEGLIN